jgi:photosynthetic reaction center cytochrome c subunit
MKLGIGISAAIAVVAILTIAMLTLSGWDRPPIEAVQNGFRGLGLEQVYNPRIVRDQLAENEVPEPFWPLEDVDMTTPKAGEIYENVEVLGHLPDDQFNRLMSALTEWVVGDAAACDYCHNTANFADGSLYTYQVSRKMLQMTMYLNSEWAANHVYPTEGASGVTCYTCHRGQPVPPAIWFEKTMPSTGIVGYLMGQNIPADAAALSSLPFDPYTPFLEQDQDIRVHTLTALPSGNEATIKQTEYTYSLMMHMSTSLGVNCTYCHNSRAFYKWEQVPPQRATAWYGIRMVRELNNDWLVPLRDVYPPNRLGPNGDAPKANCTTCHYNVYKPFFGENVVGPYPSLMQPGPTQEAHLQVQ